MRNFAIIALMLLTLAGCESVRDFMTTAKVDNPVMGPPPPRVALLDDRLQGDAYVNDPLQTADATGQTGNIVPVSQTKLSTWDHDNLTQNQVVATVNGAPIFAGEILERYGPQLAQAQKTASPEQFSRLRTGLIRRDLGHHVERKLLVENLKATLQREQIAMLEEHLASVFEEEIAGLKEQFNVNTRLEVEQELAKQNTSLSHLRDDFYTQRMAMEYLAAKSTSTAETARPDLLAYYESHPEDYAVPARVLWQQIVVDFSKHGGKAGALQVLTDAINALRRGEDFGEMAKKYSDGPTAARGGQWDWTQVGSISQKDIEQALFEQPPGLVEHIFETESSFRLVKINDRQEAGQIPFAKVQNEIKQKLEEESRRESTQKVLKGLRDAAVIHTIFDEDDGESQKTQHASRESGRLPFE